MLGTLILLMTVLIDCEGEANQSPSGSSTSNICQTKECITTAARILRSLDRTADPCEDFYRYACGGWMDEQIVPAHRKYIATLYHQEVHLATVRNILQAESKASDPGATKKAKDLYASCMDYATKQKRGTEIVDIINRKFGSWPLVNRNWNANTFDLKDILAKAILLGVQPLITFDIGFDYVSVDGKYVVTNTIVLKPPVFTFPIPTYLNTIHNKRVREVYQQKILLDAKRFGLNMNNSVAAMADAMEIIEVETKLAQIYAENRIILRERFNISKLQNKFGQLMNWTHFLFNITSSPRVGLIDVTEQERLLVFNSLYLGNITAYFSQLSNRTQANYIIWRAVDTLETIIDPLDTKINVLWKSVVDGVTISPTTEESCTIYVSKIFDLVVHRQLYTDKFPPEEKAQIRTIIQQTKAAYFEIIDEATWVDNVTANVMKEKITALTDKMMFYEESMNRTILERVYENLTIDRNHFLKNVIKEREETFFRVLRTLRLPFEFPVVTQTYEMYALYNMVYHRIEFTSIIFEPPAFITSIPQLLNYGGIGIGIAHEISHILDTKQYRLNKDLRAGDWWDSQTVLEYMRRVQCIKNQYKEFLYVDAGQKINENLTFHENFCDVVGLKVAYRKKRLPVLNFTNDQLFFLSVAQLWCKVESREGAIETMSIPHSPFRFRTIGPLQNSKNFADAFRCSNGSYMNPVHKCEIW